MALEIDDTTAQILDAFDETDGYATTGYLLRSVEVSRVTLNRRLRDLRVADCVEYVDEPTAFMRLSNDPREDDDG